MLYGVNYIDPLSLAPCQAPVYDVLIWYIHCIPLNVSGRCDAVVCSGDHARISDYTSARAVCDQACADAGHCCTQTTDGACDKLTCMYPSGLVLWHTSIRSSVRCNYSFSATSRAAKLVCALNLFPRLGSGRWQVPWMAINRCGGGEKRSCSLHWGSVGVRHPVCHPVWQCLDSYAVRPITHYDAILYEHRQRGLPHRMVFPGR